MICTKPGCEGRLRVTNTYTLRTSKWQRAECESCRRVYSIQAVARPAEIRGQGAKAQAARAKRESLT